MMESGKVFLTVQSADKIFYGVTIQMKPQTENKRFSRILGQCYFCGLPISIKKKEKEKKKESTKKKEKKKERKEHEESV